MVEDFDLYDDLEARAFSYAEGADSYIDEEDFIEDYDDADDFEDSLKEMDFSELQGKSYKKNLTKVNRKIEQKQKVKKVIVPDDRKVIVEGRTKPVAKRPMPKQRAAVAPTRKAAIRKPAKNDIPLKDGKYQVRGKGDKKLSKVIVPDDRQVIVEGVSKFILSQSKTADSIKNNGYYKGKKLKELVLTFNNNSAVPFELELFNPSMPLDYLYSTSLNLNDKIQVAGGAVSYTDVLFNILANSTMIPNAKFVFSGAAVSAQKVIPIIVMNKSIEGKEKIYPFNLDLQIDNMQVASDMVMFDFTETINRPFIPDGMDVIKYTVLPFMTVTMAFFYDQISLKKVFREEARKDKGLL